mmetsp:Transcript_52493/g.127103  ORF Transcript_52493/g.127103 Transcript_52493/m.127103 type:complete len:475 (-) Transcript_52493:2173-3597(-)
MTDTNDDDDGTLQLFCQIATQHGTRKPVKVSKTIDAKSLREEVSKTTGIPLMKLKVIFRGRIIKDDSNSSIVSAIEEYRLEQDSVLHCMGPVEETATSKEAAATTTTNTTTTAVKTNASGPAPSAAAPAVSSATSAAAASAAPPVRPAVATTSTSTSGDPLTVALDAMRTQNTPSTYQTAVETLLKVLSNITDKPHEEKYRKVKRSNAAFSKRLGSVTGGHDAMAAVGFSVIKDGEEEFYTLNASAEAWEKLLSSKSQVQRAVDQVRTTSTPNTSIPAAGIASAGGLGAGGGFPGMGGGFPGMGAAGMNANNPMMSNMMNSPEAQSAMMEMMSNPQTLRAALQNPMVQNMLQNDPSVPPQMRQHMEQLTNNPQMLDMMAQSMQDPMVRSQMAQAMAMRGSMGPSAPGGFGGMPSNFGSPSAAAAPAAAPGAQLSSSTQQSQQQGGGNGRSGGGDTNQTEEDMIAEAIRRSLEES